ncbi:hypothetical protein EYF80_018023 [Liparis tanakae]|uniref:Uncharacterized protein n=1 Tax=Liparis tanakae TaxID=230148 RepID=A0A4Z2I337_9TELE|nr:hypothetical protein EYF80_018023 [Liparis tanakae]
MLRCLCGCGRDIGQSCASTNQFTCVLEYTEPGNWDPSGARKHELAALTLTVEESSYAKRWYVLTLPGRVSVRRRSSVAFRSENGINLHKEVTSTAVKPSVRRPAAAEDTAQITSHAAHSVPNQASSEADQRNASVPAARQPSQEWTDGRTDGGPRPRACTSHGFYFWLH